MRSSSSGSNFVWQAAWQQDRTAWAGRIMYGRHLLRCLPADGVIERFGTAGAGVGREAGMRRNRYVSPPAAAAAPTFVSSREEKHGITRSTKSSRERLVRAGSSP